MILSRDSVFLLQRNASSIEMYSYLST